MTKFTVSIPLVSYYELEIEAESQQEVIEKVGQFVASDVSEGSYQGWDIDFSNIGFDGLVKESQAS